MTKLQEQILKKQELKNKNFISKLNKDKIKAKSKRLKSLGSDPSLLFLPIASEMMLQKLTDIGDIFSNIESDIEQLNEDIDLFNNNQIGIKENLINRKNALLNQINQIENKINQINKILDKLNSALTVLKILTTTMKLLPLPTSPIPITAGILNTLSSLLEKTNKTISAFKSMIKTIEGELTSIKLNLEDLKNQIKLIEDKIENQLTNESNNNNDITKSLNQSIKLGTHPEIFNGFKFAVKEENIPNAPVVSGYKRHYAVAIDRNNVEVLKTEPSFTLDVQVLIDSLKLIITKENLKP